jgi:hypothetical protein
MGGKPWASGRNGFGIDHIIPLVRTDEFDVLGPKSISDRRDQAIGIENASGTVVMEVYIEWRKNGES